MLNYIDKLTTSHCLTSSRNFTTSRPIAPSTLAIFDSAVRRNGEGIALLYHASIGGTMFLTFCFFFRS